VPPGAAPLAAPPPGGGRAAATSAATLVGTAVTLGLGLVVAIALLVSGDVPGDYFSSTGFQINVFSLAVLAPPLALLVTWDEYDLSVIGGAALGGIICANVVDDPGSDILPGLLVAAIVGAVAGAAVGLVRWVTGAHSALVSLGAGTLMAGIAFQIGPGNQGLRFGTLDGAGLPIAFTVVVVAAGVGLALLFAPRAGEPTDRDHASPHPRVVAGFALSGLAAGVFGALFAARAGFLQPGQTSIALVLGFTAVAVAGAVRGSGVVAPLAAVPAAAVTMMLADAAPINGWNQGERDLILGGVFVVTVALAQGLRRLLSAGERPAVQPPTAPLAPTWAPPPR